MESFLIKEVDNTEGEVINPFARSGLVRSPTQAARVKSHQVSEYGTPRVGSAIEDTQMSRAELKRALTRNRDGLPKLLVVAEQLDELIGYTSGRNNHPHSCFRSNPFSNVNRAHSRLRQQNQMGYGFERTKYVRKPIRP